MRAFQRREVLEFIGHMMRGTVNMEVKMALQDSIIIPTMACASEMWK